MRRNCFLAVFLFVIVQTTRAQDNKNNRQEIVDCSNHFLDLYETNADSAIYYLHRLVTIPNSMGYLKLALLDAFPWVLLPNSENRIEDDKSRASFPQQKAVAYKILNSLINDSSEIIRYHIRPLYDWVKVSEHPADLSYLRAAASDFIEKELAGDVYDNRAARYGLLIYQVMYRYPELNNTSAQLLQTLCKRLKEQQVVGNPDSLRGIALDRRASLRYLYAYANYLQGNIDLINKDLSSGDIHFKQASDYSPDAIDNQDYAGYYYDMRSLFAQSKGSFTDDYINYLTNNKRETHGTLDLFLQLALKDPNYKEKLEAFYNKTPASTPFREYWARGFSRVAKPTSALHLTELDGFKFTTGANNLRWTLIDFWGTWCAPCRHEHPDLDSFYRYISAHHSQEIQLLTVACGDKLDRVKDYMSQHKYSFPVAMADANIEKQFKITHYPTKVLISPQGGYIVIPDTGNWMTFVTKYVEL